MEDMKAVVIDNGSALIRAGAGDSCRAVFPTTIGRPRAHASNQPCLKESYVGDLALSKSSSLDLCWPIRRGLVTNWCVLPLFPSLSSAQGMTWRRFGNTRFTRSCGWKPRERNVLLSEPPLNPRENNTNLVRNFRCTRPVPE
jgi:actin-related protein